MNWHQKFKEERTFSERLADRIAEQMGSWRFIIIQTAFVVVWMGVNAVGIFYHWDAYPFILLNLLFSTQAAYAAPIIMMAQNRQNAKDRIKAEEDYNTNLAAKREIETLMKSLDRIEESKLNKILEKLEIKYEPPTIDETVLKDVAFKFQEMNKFNGAFNADETSFIRGAQWQSRRLVEQLEQLEMYKLMYDDPDVFYQDWMLAKDTKTIEEILYNLKAKSDERDIQ